MKLKLLPLSGEIKYIKTNHDNIVVGVKNPNPSSDGLCFVGLYNEKINYFSSMNTKVDDVIYLEDWTVDLSQDKPRFFANKITIFKRSNI